MVKQKCKQARAFLLYTLSLLKFAQPEKVLPPQENGACVSSTRASAPIHPPEM